MTSRHMLIVDSIPEGEYVSLVSVLDDYWGMAWKRLPKTQRQAWQKTEANGKHWDEHDAGERRRAAEIYDIGHGPSGIFFQQIGFYELEKPARLAAISALEAASLLLIREGDLLTRLGVPCPDKDAPLLARQLLNADEMVRGKPEDELIRATYQPLGEWLRRAKNAGIEYLPALDLAVKMYGQQQSTDAVASISGAGGTAASGEAGKQEDDKGSKPVVVLSAWEVKHPNDPVPSQSWYTPARHFARQLIASDSSLLAKRGSPSAPGELPKKVQIALTTNGIYKRGGKVSPKPETILKAFVGVDLSK